MAISTPTSALLLLLLPAIFGLLIPSCTADNILYTDETLYTGQSLTYGSYRFIIQSDCNLVLYDSGNAVWSSGTDNRGYNCILKMQADGNLVIYSNGNALWASNTSRDQGNYILVLQRDRNVVIYGPAIWATGTNYGTSGVVISRNATGTPVVVASAAEDVNNRKIAMVTKN
ncbi:unnamed protein product [Musa acuminata subsp. burmannicoides]